MAARPTEVTLSLDDCEPNALPPVCAKCGAEATCEKRVWFRYVPTWVIPVVGASFVLFMPCVTVSNKVEPLMLTAAVFAAPFGLVLRKYRESRYAHLPVCEKHQGIWNWGTTFAAFSFGLLPVSAMAGFGLAAVAESLAGIPQRRLTDSSLFSIAVIALPMLGFFAGFWAHFGTGVRASRVTKGDLTLVAVAPEFAEAVEAQQDAEDAAYAARRGKATSPPAPLRRGAGSK